MRRFVDRVHQWSDEVCNLSGSGSDGWIEGC